MYCPVCHAENQSDAKFCTACNFNFSSPGGKNHQGPALTRYFALNAVNFITVILAMFLLLILLAGYLFLRFFSPPDTWVLAIQANDDKSKLYALNWKTQNSLELGESEGNWTAQPHLALPSLLQIGGIQPDYYGRWQGGAAVYSPRTHQVIATLRKNDRWQVNITDLRTGKQNILTETTGEPFVSVAPEQAVTAITVPATEASEASLTVFSGTQKLDLTPPFPETKFPNGILAPDGRHLLYITSVMATTESITQTRGTTKTQQFYQTTLNIVNLGDNTSKEVQKFDHGLPEEAEAYLYAFTPDSQSIIYQTPGLELYQADITGLKTTKIYTPSKTTSALEWKLTPDSNHVALFLSATDKPQVMDFLLIALPSGQTTILNQAFQADRTASLVFLDTTHILFSPQPNQQIIYDMVSGVPENFNTTAGASLNCPVIAEDHSLVGLILADKRTTDFLFFNLLKGDVPDLNFSMPSGAVAGLDFAASNILLQKGEILYQKNLLRNDQPSQLVDDYAQQTPAFFTADVRYLLHTSNSTEQPGLYRVNLENRQREKLLDRARLLAPINQIWCQNKS